MTSVQFLLICKYYSYACQQLEGNCETIGHACTEWALQQLNVGAASYQTLLNELDTRSQRTERLSSMQY